MAERRVVHVPAREGRALRLSAGRRFRVVGLEGGQVADTFAFCADDLSEYHSAEHHGPIDIAPKRSGSSSPMSRERPAGGIGD